MAEPALDAAEHGGGAGADAVDGARVVLEAVYDAVVDDPIAVVVEAVAGLDADLGIARPGVGAARGRGAARALDDASRRAAGADACAGRPDLGLRAAGRVVVGEALVGLAVAVVVQPVARLDPGQAGAETHHLARAPGRPRVVGADPHPRLVGAGPGAAGAGGARRGLWVVEVVGVALVDQPVAVGVEAVADLVGPRVHGVVGVVAVRGRGVPVAVAVAEAVARGVPADTVLVHAVAAPLGRAGVHGGVGVVAVVGRRPAVVVLVVEGAEREVIGVAVAVADVVGGGVSLEHRGAAWLPGAGVDARVLVGAVPGLGGVAVAVEVALDAPLVDDAVAVVVLAISAEVGGGGLDRGGAAHDHHAALAAEGALDHAALALALAAARPGPALGPVLRLPDEPLVGLAVAVVVLAVAELDQAGADRRVTEAAGLEAVLHAVGVFVDAGCVAARAVLVDAVAAVRAGVLDHPGVGAGVGGLAVAGAGGAARAAAGEGAVGEAVGVGVAGGGVGEGEQADRADLLGEEVDLTTVEGHELPAREVPGGGEGDGRPREGGLGVGDLDDDRPGDRIEALGDLELEAVGLGGEQDAGRALALVEEQAQGAQLGTRRGRLGADLEQQRVRRGVAVAAGGGGGYEAQQQRGYGGS